MTHMSSEQIKAALKAGIITENQARAMQGLQVSQPAENPDETSKISPATIGHEDDMRFVRSFSDIFIAIGLMILSAGLTAVASIFEGGIYFLLGAVIMWIFAEFFGRRRRQHLPTLVTALFFLIFVQIGLSQLLSANLSSESFLWVALITCLAMGIFYWRIRFPFCMALIALSALYLFFAILYQIVPNIVQSHSGWVILIAGLITFSAALYFDLKDIHRTTRFSDNAFWLHFTAAPLIIHGLALILIDLKPQKIFNTIPIIMIDHKDALLLMLMVLMVTFVGLAINRRALLVSSLGYAGLAIGYLIKDSDLKFGTIIALTLLILGAAIIFLGAAWHHARNQLIKILPSWPVFPPPFDPNYKP